MGVDERAIYGIWDAGTLIAVGTPSVIALRYPEITTEVMEASLNDPFEDGLMVRLVTPSDGARQRNRWRDIAAWHLRDVVGLNYKEIADYLAVKRDSVAAGVSRVRCGRYPGWPKETT